ncbi:hypothetical protein KAR91_62770 [Candidatus Pacearchaeota archaeon]|nr:hypothetical protein [Candidatus Pacearchaeota archaeon]
MVLVELNFIFKVEPFATWYFPIIWIAYILVIDAIVYKLKKKSLISNYFFHFLGILVISAVFWEVFEVANIFVSNWTYHGAQNLSGLGKSIFRFLSFATVLPALFETTSLIRAVHLFDKIKLKYEFGVSKLFIYSMILSGIVCFFLPIFLPALAFPLVWLSFYLVLDPINYLHKQPSIIGHIKKKKLAIPLSLLLAGIILGFLWEFWNYWAIIKWTYQIPYVGFFKIFEMPILGYLGYFPFALELYAMYYFVRSLFLKEDSYLIR